MSGHTLRPYWIAFIASLGGFLQSYVTCIIAGALIFISTEFHLGPFRQGHLASIILIGAIVGTLYSGYLADRIGRRKTLFLSALLYLVTAAVVFIVKTFAFLILLRFVTGLAVGMSSIVVPMYLAEIAPTARRGAFVTFYQFSVTVGTVAAYLVSFMLTQQGDWRMMFFYAAIPAVLQLAGFLFFPDSPRWLLLQGREEEAQKVIHQLGGNLVIPPTSPQQSLFASRFSFLILMGLVLSISQQFTGINAIVYFTPKILNEAGFKDPQYAIIATVFVGITNMIATLITIFLVDRFGRRKLLLISQFGIILALFMLIFSFATDWTSVNGMAAWAVILYVFLYSLGFGPIVWVLLSEIFPLAVRAKAFALCTFASWFSNYLVVLFFPHFIHTLGAAWSFSIYAALTLIAYLFCLRFVPETKGKTLEQLEKQLVRSK